MRSLIMPLKIIIVLRRELRREAAASGHRRNQTCEVPEAADSQTCSLLLTETLLVREKCS